MNLIELKKKAEAADGSLYEVSGEVLDINTLPVNRNDLRALVRVAEAAKALIQYENDGAPNELEAPAWPDWDRHFTALREALEGVE